MRQPIDPATLGDGPFLLVSEGELREREQVFVDVVHGPLDVEVISDTLRSQWGWPAERRLNRFPTWHGMSPYLLWDAQGRSPWTVMLAPTSRRVVGLVQALIREGVSLRSSTIHLASWADEHVDRLSALLENSRSELSPDLDMPPWLLSFDDADEAEANLQEIEYELGERVLPPGEKSFGAGPWMVYSVGHQGDVHTVDVILGDAHRYSIAGSIRREWGSGDDVLELRGQWWDVGEDGRITVWPDDNPFEVVLIKVGSAVASAIAAYEPYHCCSPGIFDLPRWPDDTAHRFAAALKALTLPLSTFVSYSVLSHASRLERPDQLSSALEALAQPPGRRVDAGSAADLVVIWAALEELIGTGDARAVTVAEAGVAVELAGAQGPPEYGCRRAGPFHVVWYRHEHRDRGSFPLAAVDPAGLAEFVSSAESGCQVRSVAMSAVNDDHASLTVHYRRGKDIAIRRGRVELSTRQIVAEIP